MATINRVPKRSNLIVRLKCGFQENYMEKSESHDRSLGNFIGRP